MRVKAVCGGIPPLSRLILVLSGIDTVSMKRKLWEEKRADYHKELCYDVCFNANLYALCLF
ncbi:hypothetical protein GGR09_000168 [Bartonella heixiaziensis]